MSFIYIHSQTIFNHLSIQSYIHSSDYLYISTINPLSIFLSIQYFKHYSILNHVKPIIFHMNQIINMIIQHHFHYHLNFQITFNANINHYNFKFYKAESWFLKPSSMNITHSMHRKLHKYHKHIVSKHLISKFHHPPNLAFHSFVGYPFAPHIKTEPAQANGKV